MSAYIPFEIQVEIIKRVPAVKSLIRFISVSKRWKSLIDSSKFINDHSVNQTHPHHLLLSCYADSKCKYVSILDDDSFPHHKSSLVVSPTVNLFGNAWILDCSHGLVCLYGFTQDLAPSFVLWNPSIRKSVSIVLPHVFALVGFGVCPKTSDPTIVTITYSSEIHTVNWTAQVFTLCSTAWRSIPINVPMHLKQYKPATDKFEQVIIDGVIYWATYGPLADNYSDMITSFSSFDLTTEEFIEVDLPDSLARPKQFRSQSISKLKESLVVLDDDGDEYVFAVWMMTKDGDTKSSFAKLFVVSDVAYDGCHLSIIIGFRRNGQPIREHQCVRDDHDSVVTKLEAYEPSTKHSSDLGIYATSDSSFMMTSYRESLFLLNHFGSVIQ